MNKKILLGLAICYSLGAFSQDKTEQPEKPVELKFSGFIMNNMFFDTRKNVEALDGQVLLFPKEEAKDSVGEDMNKVQNLSLLSFASRLRLGITGPDALGAKTSGLIEFDFTARANTASVRFRQAWVKLNWEKTELLVGRTWHPIASMDVIPSVMALSIGAPFQPFNRSEQITVTQKAGKLNFIFSAIFQNDYVNNGPSDKTYLYQTNAIIPNLHGQLKYKSDNAIFGVGLDYKRLKPRNFVTSPVDKKIRSTNAHVNCAALLVYGQVKSGKLTLSGKSILATNISENLMVGAYGISSYDTLTGHEEYVPFKHFYVWGNISYGSKVKVSLFGGYLKNLGTSENIVAPHKYLTTTVYGLGETIRQEKTIGKMTRIVPTISYTSGKTILALEVEHNIVTYGSINYSDKGKIINGKNVSGTRVLCTMYYNF
jgi:hypothetical protein